MSFAEKIKRAFGFGSSSYPEENDELLNDSDEAPSAAVHPIASGNDAEPNPAAPEPECPTFDPDVQKRIFDGVVEVFNASMPDFIRKSLDTDKERQYLYSVMEQSLKDYLGKLIVDSQTYAEARLRSQNEANSAELDRLRGETKKLEQQRSTIKEQQLSSDRQRRALSERVKDLENQVASLEAEREQYQLENMSLLNKVRLGEVHGAEAPVADTAATEALQKQIDDLRQQLETERKAKEDASDKLKTTSGKLREANDKLREAEQIEHEVEAIQKQMEAVGDVIAKRDAKIAKLRSANKELRRRLTAAENAAQAAARNASIAQLTMQLEPEEPNLFTLDEPEPQASEAAVAEPEATYAKKGDTGEEKEMLTTKPLTEEDIDDGFEAADWFVSVPPQGTTLRSEIGESDFGYHEPPKKPSRKENDAQMSLF